MRPVWPALLLMAGAPTTVMAQAPMAWDLSAGTGGSGHRAALSVLGTVIGRGSVFQIAVGGRLTWYGGDTVDLAVRGASGGCPPVAISCIPAELPIDPAVVGLNLFGEASVGVTPGVRLGANLDLVGVAAGPDRVADPARWSLFLYGNSDRGSLNSEFFASLRVSGRVRVRGGWSHYVLGYELDADGGGSARYQRFFDAAFVAARIDL